MTITKVSYGKTYSLGNYCSERVDLESTVDEGEDVLLVVSTLKQQCDNIHIKNNPERYEPKNYPHLYQEQDTKYQHPISEINNYNTFDIVTPQPIETQLTQEQKIHNLITQSTSLPELKQYYILSQNKKYPELKDAYEKKLLELSK